MNNPLTDAQKQDLLIAGEALKNLGQQLTMMGEGTIPANAEFLDTAARLIIQEKVWVLKDLAFNIQFPALQPPHRLQKAI